MLATLSSAPTFKRAAPLNAMMAKADQGHSPPRTASRPRDPRLDLSFFRKSTSKEIDDGASGYLAWDVEPSGDFQADIERGKAIAEEALSFMAAHSTVGNMGLVADMLRDILRSADETHRGLVTGFGLRLGQFATVGITVAGGDAFSKHDQQEKARVGLT